LRMMRTKSIEDLDDALMCSSLGGDDSSSNCSLHESRSSLTESRRSKSVSFGDLVIRSHEVVLGDHPYCVSGCPLELGWNHDDDQIVSLEDFESQRGPHKPPSEFRTTRHERQMILAKTTSLRDVKVHDRKLHRSRRMHQDLNAFFQPE
jgi:hypothetical protein